jgi:hypothetical protein
MDARQTRILILKHLSFILLIVVLSVVQGAPSLLKWKAVCPIPLVACSTAIAIREGPFEGGLYGLLAGIITDTWAFHFLGLASLIFLSLGVAAGVLTRLLLHSSYTSAALISAAAAFFYGFLAHQFIFSLWGYEGSQILYWQSLLPSSLFTGVWGVVLFWAVGAIGKRFSAHT